MSFWVEMYLLSKKKELELQPQEGNHADVLIILDSSSSSSWVREAIFQTTGFFRPLIFFVGAMEIIFVVLKDLLLTT